MILINGENQQGIDCTDRGFQYGDGVFETLEISNGRVVYLDHHLNRLAVGCQRLLIPTPEISILKQEISGLIQSHARSVLKIIITRGVGGRGYRQPETINATRVLSIHPFPDYPADYKTEGVNIRFCDTRLGQNRRLAGLKHLNRLEQVLARAEWQDRNIQEGLMFDSEDNLIEGTMTNLFLVENARLLTPQLDQCGVDGIVRNIIIELAQVNGLIIEELRVSKARILAAEEVFLTNSIIGMWPVKNLDGHAFGIGEITRQLDTWLDDFKQKDCQNGL